jgi:hypothetical protein
MSTSTVGLRASVSTRELVYRWGSTVEERKGSWVNRLSGRSYLPRYHGYPLSGDQPDSIPQTRDREGLYVDMYMCRVVRKVIRSATYLESRRSRRVSHDQQMPGTKPGLSTLNGNATHLSGMDFGNDGHGIDTFVYWYKVK